MNIFIASGNLGRDYELAYTPNGKPIGIFALPVKQGFGEFEKTTWIQCKVLGDRAEKLTFMTKGMKVTIRGSIVLETWETDKGKGSKLVCIVAEIDFPPKADTQPAEQQNSHLTPSQPQKRETLAKVAQSTPVNRQVATDDKPFDDQIPF